MPNRSERDRDNDIGFLTPLLLMALIVVGGMLLLALTGHALASV
jgi:UPF0716 family protein affecting phage T7 exclusion